MNKTALATISKYIPQLSRSFIHVVQASECLYPRLRVRFSRNTDSQLRLINLPFLWAATSCTHFIHSFIHSVFLSTMIILRKPQMAELIEAGRVALLNHASLSVKIKQRLNTVKILKVGFSGKVGKTKTKKLSKQLQ